MTNIVLADDHAFIRTGLKSLLVEAGYKVIGEAENCTELHTLSLTLGDSIDLYICDCHMPGGGPIENHNQLKATTPKAKIIFLAGIESVLLFRKLLQLGINGLISKRTQPDQILQLITQAIAGESVISDNIATAITENEELLTKKEFEILELIILGMNNREISEHLKKSAGTINTHRANLMKKTNCSTVVELVNYARDSGLYETRS